MADISKINGIAIGKVFKLSGRTLANGDIVMGVVVSSTIIAAYTLDSDAGSGLTTGTASPSNSVVPTGWAASKNSGWTVYGSTTTHSTTSTNRAWCFEHGQTGSGTTGVGGGMVGGVDATDGAWDNSGRNGDSQFRYLLFESSTIGNSNTFYSAVRRFLMRTAAFDFSTFTSITMTFWFHIRGGTFNADGALAIAATTSNSSASSDDQAGTGLGLTSDSAGGCTISYDSDGDGTLNASGVRITGPQQTDGETATDTQNAASKWRKASIDLSNAAGESSVYLYFYSQTKAAANSFRADVCIDNIKITGL